MTHEQIFSAMNLLGLAGWAALALAPLRRGALILAARAVAVLLAVAYAVLMTRAMLGPDGGDGGFGSLAGVMSLFSHAAVMLPAWIHYLAFDLWVGTWEAEDAGKSGVPHWLLLPALALTLWFGPMGLLLYLVLRTGWTRLARK